MSERLAASETMRAEQGSGCLKLDGHGGQWAAESSRLDCRSSQSFPLLHGPELLSFLIINESFAS